MFQLKEFWGFFFSRKQIFGKNLNSVQYVHKTYYTDTHCISY